MSVLWRSATIPDDEYPLLFSFFAYPVLDLIGILVGLVTGALLSSFLPYAYAGVLGMLIGLVVIIAVAVSSMCPHCGARNFGW
jgi:hypothetical protein